MNSFVLSVCVLFGMGFFADASSYGSSYGHQSHGYHQPSYGYGHRQSYGYGYKPQYG